MPAHDPSQCELIDQLAEEFAQRYRRGEQPPLKEYLDKYPELAGDIRTLFPTLVEMEQLKEEPGNEAAVVETLPLRQVGDYRLLREVGRGAMGVVYEAEQMSLGRRVAVKVLSAHFAPDRQSLERFRREARSAAQLHHTNIVPVFEVGQDGDLCYYAMQFIQGQSLDQILVELRRLRGCSLARGERPLPETCETQVADAGRPAVDQLAQSLLTGRFQIERAAAFVVEGTEDNARGADATPLADASSSAVLPGQMDLSSVRTDRPHYFQSVARIGYQIATALAYAHARKVIHRDIKPSNLLLDTAGVVWLTDFGLAKTQEAALTTTGDIVGTLRYMSPERFRGEGDERSDVYALGLTLYEMLVLRPAFDARDRLQLIDQIKNQDPPRPRLVDRRIPRHLETIVLTAIHKEPKRRYQTAEAMAEDLRCFLADEPIKAKQASHLARLRLWGRRNPALATLLLVLALVAAASTATAFYLNAVLAETEEARLMERMAKAQFGIARDRAKEAEKRAEMEQIRALEALVWQAHGARLSRRPGQRFDALDALGKAAVLGRELGQPPEWFDRLRNETIAALALPDIHITQEFDGFPPGTVCVELSDDFQLYVRTTDKGLCTIRRVADDVEIARLPELGERTVAGFGSGLMLAVRGESSRRFQLWDLSGDQPVRRFQERGVQGWQFRADGRLLALEHQGGSISVYDVATGRPAYRLAATEMTAGLAPCLHPTESLVACASYFHRMVQVRDLRTGAVVVSVNPPWPRNGSCAWSPDGRTLLVSQGDGGKIQEYAFDPAHPALRPTRTIEGPFLGCPFLVYNPAGDRFVSRGWSNSVTLFDAVSGQLLFSTPSLPKAAEHFLRFDRTGQRLAAARIGDRHERVGIWSVADARAYRALVHSGRAPTCGKPAIHPGGRLAAIGLEDGVALFDLETGGELAHLPITKWRGTMARFDGTGNLLTNDFAGFFRWPLRPDPDNRHRLIVGPPERLPFHPGDGQISTSRDGRVIAQTMWNGYGMQPYAGGWILYPNSPTPRRVRAGQGAGDCSVSPDGRWVAFGWGTVDVYDAATGQRVWHSPAQEFNHCRFSPDGRWLATDGDGGRLYAVGTWEPGPQLGAGTPWDISPDSTLAILGQSNGIYRLVQLDTGRELARLEDPEQNTGAAAFAPDGAKLVVAAKNGLRVWDLRRIRRELTRLGLDWDAPPYREADGDVSGPLEVQVVGADVLTPRDAKGLNNLAWHLATGPVEQRDPARALNLIQDALKMQPDNLHLVNTLGVVQYRLGRYEAAVDTLEKRLRIGKGDLAAFDLFFLAMCHAKLGAPDKARDCFDRAVKWTDDNKGLSAHHIEELKAFRAEAESVLAQPPGQAKK